MKPISIINGLGTKELSIDSATQLSTFMERLNTLPVIMQAQYFFLLVDIKQGLIDTESYEILADFKRLEDLHGINIPFKV